MYKAIDDTVETYRGRRWMYLNLNLEEALDEQMRESMCFTNIDECLTISDVASILGFSLEHVQNNVLEHLQVRDITYFDKEYKKYLRNCTYSPRLKRMVSKSSLACYIANIVSITARTEVLDIEKDSKLVSKLREILGKRAKIQQVLIDAGEHINNKYKADCLHDREIKRVKNIKESISKEENDYNLLYFLEAGTMDTEELVEYYTNLQEELYKSKNVKKTDIFDFFTFNMFSLKQLKEIWDLKYTKQVYRRLETISYIAIKLNEEDYSRVEKKKGDRNIRYLISTESLMQSKKRAYRLPLDYYVYEKLKSIAGAMSGFLALEDILYKEVLEFAEANKDKYIKKEEQQDENE